MKISEGRDLFTALFPDMMKATRLLIIDHDICRYHSFDLLRYQLYLDAVKLGDAGKEHFMSIKPEYRCLLNAKTELASQVQFAQRQVRQFNVFDCFGCDLGVHDGAAYTAKIHDMLQDPAARITPTDVNSRFGIIFDRKTITGYILQYTGDTNHPYYMDKLTQFKDPMLLNLNAAMSIIMEHQINAVMICSTELAVKLATALYQAGYKKSITFIIGRYAYNFRCEDGKMVEPLLNKEMGVLEVNLKHEFGYFDPYSGLTYRERVRATLQKEGASEDDQYPE